MAPVKHAVGRKKIVELVAKRDRTVIKTGKNEFTGRRAQNPHNQKSLKARGYCAAKKKRQDSEKATEYCLHKAGWGTEHPGMGCCKYHGGSTATHNASAERRRQIEFMGRPKDISPLDAIIWAIKITAGEVEWLSTEIAKVTNKDDWIEFTVAGKQLHVLQRARADAQDRLVKYSKDAISLGLAERAVRMAEQFGQTIARLLEGIAGDLNLNKEQKAAWPAIVRNRLILLEGGQVVKSEDRKQITQG